MLVMLRSQQNLDHQLELSLFVILILHFQQRVLAKLYLHLIFYFPCELFFSFHFFQIRLLEFLFFNLILPQLLLIFEEQQQQLYSLLILPFIQQVQLLVFVVEQALHSNQYLKVLLQIHLINWKVEFASHLYPSSL